MQAKIRIRCTNTKRVTARYNCLSVTSSIKATLKGSRINFKQIFGCKCQYLSVTFAKNPNWHQNGRETKDQEESKNIL